jgi:hypothetical protein
LSPTNSELPFVKQLNLCVQTSSVSSGKIFFIKI